MSSCEEFNHIRLAWQTNQTVLRVALAGPRRGSPFLTVTSGSLFQRYWLSIAGTFAVPERSAAIPYFYPVLYRHHANHIARPSAKAVRPEPMRIRNLEIAIGAGTSGGQRPCALGTSEQQHVRELFVQLHVNLLEGLTSGGFKKDYALLTRASTDPARRDTPACCGAVRYARWKLFGLWVQRLLSAKLLSTASRSLLNFASGPTAPPVRSPRLALPRIVGSATSQTAVPLRSRSKCEN